MKKNTQDIKGLTLSDLRAQLAKEVDQLRGLRFAHAVSPIENPLRIRYARKQVARLHTHLNHLLKQQAQPTKTGDLPKKSEATKGSKSAIKETKEGS